MHPLIKIFFVGMFISFVGSLPLGTLNVAAMQISVASGVTSAVLFSLGSLTAEIVYVRLSLVAMDWIRKQERIFRILEWVTLIIVFGLAAASFYAALHPTMQKNVILDSKLPKFLLGFVMSAVNPVQIHYNVYIVGIGIGTFIGNLIFIFGGRIIADKINNNQDILNWVVGGIFALTGIIQIWRMVRKKDTVHQLEHPEEMTHLKEDQIEKFEEGLDKLKHK
jgi:threonine/homoserine/homoserine lactone efflux protein